jgi:hypothetical protein
MPRAVPDASYVGNVVLDEMEQHIPLIIVIENVNYFISAHKRIRRMYQ